MLQSPSVACMYRANITRAPSLSRTFIHPSPKDLFTSIPVELIKSSGEYPAEPELSKHPVLNRTLSWSGNSEVTWKIQCTSSIPLAREDQELASNSMKSSGSFGLGNTSPFCQYMVGFFASELVINVRLASVIVVASSPTMCRVTTS